MSQTKDHEMYGQKKKTQRLFNNSNDQRPSSSSQKSQKNPDHLTLTLTKDWEMPKCPKKTQLGKYSTKKGYQC